MARNSAADNKRIQEAQAAGGHKTKQEGITSTLRKYVARRKQRGVLEFAGQIEFDPSYDYKRARWR